MICICTKETNGLLPSKNGQTCHYDNYICNGNIVNCNQKSPKRIMSQLKFVMNLLVMGNDKCKIQKLLVIHASIVTWKNKAQMQKSSNVYFGLFRVYSISRPCDYTQALFWGGRDGAANLEFGIF